MKLRLRTWGKHTHKQDVSSFNKRKVYYLFMMKTSVGNDSSSQICNWIRTWTVSCHTKKNAFCTWYVFLDFLSEKKVHNENIFVISRSKQCIKVQNQVRYGQKFMLIKKFVILTFLYARGSKNTVLFSGHRHQKSHDVVVFLYDKTIIYFVANFTLRLTYHVFRCRAGRSTLELLWTLSDDKRVCF